MGSNIQPCLSIRFGTSSIRSAAMLVFLFPANTYSTSGQTILNKSEPSLLTQTILNLGHKPYKSAIACFHQLASTKQGKFYCDKPNNNTTQPESEHCSWVGHENDCAYHPTPPPPTPPQKLNGEHQEPQINRYSAQLHIM